MKFGYFDDANKEYVITSPKTPLHGSTIWVLRISFSDLQYLQWL